MLLTRNGSHSSQVVKVTMQTSDFRREKQRRLSCLLTVMTMCKSVSSLRYVKILQLFLLPPQLIVCAPVQQGCNSGEGASQSGALCSSSHLSRVPTVLPCQRWTHVALLVLAFHRKSGLTHSQDRWMFLLDHSSTKIVKTWPDLYFL